MPFRLSEAFEMFTNEHHNQNIRGNMLVRKSVVSALANYYITVNDDLEVHVYGLNGTTPVFNTDNMSDANRAVKYFEDRIKEGEFEELHSNSYPLTASDDLFTYLMSGRNIAR